MKTIVAIGGGEIGSFETLVIDEAIVGLAQKKTPRLLFIPTASQESERYIETVHRVYGDMLGCVVSALKIPEKAPAAANLEKQILSSDIIYVGGGNTRQMMDLWKANHIDSYLWQAYDNGIVLSGLSAGAICWFDFGYSDSRLKETGEYCVVAGLGIIPALHCPHYNERPEFDDFMQTQTMPAIALEDQCAFVLRDDSFKVVSNNGSAKAYLIKNIGDSLSKERLGNPDFIPADRLFF